MNDDCHAVLLATAGQVPAAKGLDVEAMELVVEKAFWMNS